MGKPFYLRKLNKQVSVFASIGLQCYKIQRYNLCGDDKY